MFVESSWPIDEGGPTPFSSLPTASLVPEIVVTPARRGIWRRSSCEMRRKGKLTCTYGQV